MSNNVVNTFFMLFKSDTKQARAEIDALDKKIDAHRAKGKQISADEKKEMSDQVKQRRELNDTLKETQNNTEKLIESATQAAAAYVSFRAIKSGLLNAQQLNRELTIQTDLWQQNANDVAAYGAAVKAAGGNAQSALGWYQGIRDSNAAVGLQTMDFDKLMDRIHGQVRGLSAANAQLVFGQYGITDKGQQTLLRKDDAEYYKEIEHQKEITAATAAGAEASQKYGTAVDNLNTSMTNLWTVIGEDVLPALTGLIHGLTSAATWLSKNKGAAEAFFGVLVGSAIGLSRALPALLLGFAGIEGGALAAAGALAGVVGWLALLVAAIPAAWIGGKELGKGIYNITHGKSWSYTKPSASGGRGIGDSMSYWMGKGYTHDQAAAITSNMMHESGGDPNSNIVDSDGKHHGGIFMWSPERRAAILKGTKIDVWNASLADQREGALWEMRNGVNGYNDAAFRRTSGPMNAANYFGPKYEGYLDINGMESMRRANDAMSIAAGTPFSAQNGTGSSSGGGQVVNVQKIEIHTAAKDPQEIMRIAQQAFKNVAREAHAQTNDAVQM